MNDYEFELIFKLARGEEPDRYLDALYQASCDDALVSTGAIGYVGLSFTRSASNAKSAIESAIKAVKQAIPHAQLERAAPDLLNLSELAFLFGFTKQNMRKYARGEAASINEDFPAPIVTGKTSYWRVEEIACWLNRQGVTDVSRDKLDTFLAIRSLNQANELLHQPNPDMTEKFTSFLQSVV